MDYGKMIYQTRKKKQHKQQTGLKEISFSMKISPHDIEVKMRKARQFIDKGHKLKINLILRGRERAYAGTNGLAQLKRLTEMLADTASVEQMSKQMVGNRLTAILSPTKKSG
jgi:translation initiation factor IF-3